MIKKIILTLSFLALASCATTDGHDSSSYSSIISRFTDRAEFYSGFANVFQFHATLLNEQVLDAQQEIRNQSFKWTESQKSTEDAKLQDSLRTESQVFLSFYSVDPKLDDLDRGQTVWRVFLDVNNKRYAGVVKKSLSLFSETIMFYPYHSRFSTAYIVKFSVPMKNIQDYPSKLTITGTIGSQSINFPAMN